MSEQFQSSTVYNEYINEIDYNFGVSINNSSGATKHTLRFYFMPAYPETWFRLSSKNNDYKIIETNEDCVEFELGSSFHCLKIDANDNIQYSQIAKPSKWSYEQTLIKTCKDFNEEKATKFLDENFDHFITVHDSYDEAMTAFDKYFARFCSNNRKLDLQRT